MSHVRCSLHILIIAIAMCISLCPKVVNSTDPKVVNSTDPKVVNSTDQIEEQWKTVLQLNKGPYAKPNETLKNDDKIIDIVTGYSDLKCSYLFSVLMHLKLTKDLVTCKPTTDKNDDVEKRNVDVTFWNEGRQILEFMYNIGMLRSKMDVFWIFAMYTERVQNYATSHFEKTEEGDLEKIDANKKRRIQDKKWLTAVHTAVTQLFEECLSETCEAYDQRLGSPLKKGSFLKIINDSVNSAQNQESQIILIGENKNKFKQQVDHNKALVPFDDKYREHLKMRYMHLNNMHKENDDMTVLLQHLGMFDERSQLSFVKLLRTLYDTSYSSLTVPLFKQIDFLKRFLNCFIQILEAIALRILHKHLVLLNSCSSWIGSVITDTEFVSKAKEILPVLTDFVDHFNLVAGNHPLIHGIITAFDKFKHRTQITKLINNIEHLLGNILKNKYFEISLMYYDVTVNKSTPFDSKESRFSKLNNLFKSTVPDIIKSPFTKKSVSFKNIVELANQYGMQAKFNDVPSAIETNVLRGRVFIEFIRKKFNCFNFNVIWSYTSITSSEWLQRLEMIEIDIEDDLEGVIEDNIEDDTDDDTEDLSSVSEEITIDNFF